MDVGGLNEIIDHGRHGMLVSSRSAKDLAEAVVKITEDLVLRNEIIQNARCRVRCLFSVDNMSLAIRKVYEEAATQNRRRDMVRHAPRGV